MQTNIHLPVVVRPAKKFNIDVIARTHANDRSFFNRGSDVSSSRKNNFYLHISTHPNWVKYVEPATGMTKFRVLLAGKSQTERQCMCNVLLQHLNFSVEYLEASCGNDALRIGIREVPNLIIFGSDIADMDGLEFLGRLNKQSGKFKIPVIEILNIEAANKGIQALKMGAHDYLLKDFSKKYFELLPVLVSRVYSEQQEIFALRQKVSIHKTVADSIPAVIYQLSLHGGAHDVHISRQISELGLTEDKWGSDAELHHQLCHEADRPIVKAALEHSYKTGEVFQCEYRIKTAGGVLRWFHDRAVAGCVKARKYGGV